jgi:hypothetical protein
MRDPASFHHHFSFVQHLAGAQRLEICVRRQPNAPSKKAPKTGGNKE